MTRRSSSRSSGRRPAASSSRSAPMCGRSAAGEAACLLRTGQHGHRLSRGVMAKPSAWPLASLDPGCGRCRFAAILNSPRSQEIKSHQISALRIWGLAQPHCFLSHLLEIWSAHGVSMARRKVMRFRVKDLGIDVHSEDIAEKTAQICPATGLSQCGRCSVVGQTFCTDCTTQAFSICGGTRCGACSVNAVSVVCSDCTTQAFSICGGTRCGACSVNAVSVVCSDCTTQAFSICGGTRCGACSVNAVSVVCSDCTTQAFSICGGTPCPAHLGRAVRRHLVGPCRAASQAQGSAAGGFVAGGATGGGDD